jgi:hypothetical protein
VLEHVQLIAEHQQLDIAVAVLLGEQGVENQAEDGVDDRQQHESRLTGNPRCELGTVPDRVPSKTPQLASDQSDISGGSKP